MPSSPQVRLSGTLPDDEQANGLEATHDRALLAPLDDVPVVGVLRVDKIVRDVRGGGSVVLYRWLRLEPLEGDGRAAVDDLLAQALEDRLGVVRLPFQGFDQEEAGS